jgi:V8-like Glu-specific endopeptidase
MRQTFLFNILTLFILNQNVQAKLFSFDKLNTEAIYSKDDREFVSIKSSPLIKKLSQSIAIIVNNEDLTKINSSTFKINKKSEIGDAPDSLNICKSEKFSSNLTINGCTGFLIGDKILVSAGHCFMSDSDCQSKSIIFDDLIINEKTNSVISLKKNIFKCSKVISSEFDFDAKKDFSIIELDRSTKRSYLSLNNNQENLKLNDSVFMIGHPLGNALMYSKNSAVTENELNSTIFKSAINSFEGNSGSPVFNATTNKVEGILVYGEEDFQFDNKLQCNRLKTYDITKTIDKSRSESVFKIENITKMINGIKH